MGSPSSSLPPFNSPADAPSSGGRETGAEAPLDLAILGGGISGLALAAWAVRENLRVAVFEKDPEPGGVMQSAREDGFLFERGPNTVLDRDASLDHLIDGAGLGDRAMRVPLRGMKRYVWHAGRLNEVPSSPLGALTTPLLSPLGKLRVFREPFIAPVREDEPLRDFAVRRLGREVYERALVPMVSGVTGGDPAAMSTEYSFPVLKELERKGGSLFRGMLARRKESGGAPRRRPNMVSFPEGLGELPRALAERLGEAWNGGVTVESVTPIPEGSGYVIRTAAGVVRAAEVALAADARAVASWIEPWSPEAAGRLWQTHYCPLAVVGLGVETSSLTLPAGFGFLTTAESEIRSLGAIFNSAFFEDRAPAGTQLLTVMLGSDRDPGALQLSDEELLEQVRRDLGRVLGWNGKALVTRIMRWERAIPQYGLEHHRLMAAVAESEQRHPGLHFFGNWSGGAAVGERVRLARELASKISRKKAENPI